MFNIKKLKKERLLLKEAKNKIKYLEFELWAFKERKLVLKEIAKIKARMKYNCKERAGYYFEKYLSCPPGKYYVARSIRSQKATKHYVIKDNKFELKWAHAYAVLNGKDNNV